MTFVPKSIFLEEISKSRTSSTQVAPILVNGDVSLYWPIWDQYHLSGGIQSRGYFQRVLPSLSLRGVGPMVLLVVSMSALVRMAFGGTVCCESIRSRQGLLDSTT